jgi:hypothetical protein
MFQSHSLLDLLNASILVVVNPVYSVEVANTSHVLGKLFSLRPGEVVGDRNYVAVGIKSGDNFLNEKSTKVVEP